MKFFTLLLFFNLPLSAQQLRAIHKKFKVPALATASVVNGKITKSVVGVRSLEYNVKVTNLDKWHFGSIGKSMTATLIAILAEKGLFNWDQPISDYLNNYKIHSDF